MIIALHISIALNLITLVLIFWSIKQYQMNNDLHEVELNHMHRGMNAMMDDFINYQVKTDRKIAELEKQLEIKNTNLVRRLDKNKKELPNVIRNVIGHIEFARPLDKK